MTIKNLSPHTKHENKSLTAKSGGGYFLFIWTYITLLSPLILMGVFLSKLRILDCIDITNKMWMFLVTFFLYAYVIKYYYYFVWEKR